MTGAFRLSNTQNRKHGLPFEVVNFRNLERVVIKCVDLVTSGIFNTEMAVLRRSFKFHSLEPHDREIHDLLRFKKVVPKRLLKDSDVLTPDDVKTVIGLLDSVKLKALVEL